MSSQPLPTTIISSDQTTPTMVSPPVMRRFAVFVDGLSRAVILPFGPTLVHRLVYRTTDIQPLTWSGVALHIAWVLAVYIIGRWLGFVLSKEFTGSRHLHVYVARLGGAAMSLHVFAYGAGLSSVGWLVLIRLVAATLSGTLCGITSGIALPEDGWAHELPHDLLLEDRSESDARRRESYSIIAPGATKIYSTGFAVSILSGGLLFRPATKDSTFRALTGAYTYSWSPLFLIGIAVGVEVILRCLFSLARTTATEGIPSSTGKVRKAIVRIVAPSQDIMKPLITMAINEEEEQEDDSCIVRVPLEHVPINRRRSLSFSTPARSRVESFTSVEDFFDCYSAFSDAEVPEEESTNTIDEGAFAKYHDGKCLYDDDSPAFVNPGQCVSTIPQGYLDLYRGNEKRARDAWENTQAWRRDMNVWRIHTLPNAWFSQIKRAYPHFVHGHSKDGYPVVYERPGQMNLKELFRSGCEISDMVHHYIFFTEFIANIVCQDEEIRNKLDSKSWGILVVLDVKGVGLSSLSGDVLKYLKQAGDTNSSHYPLTMKRAFVINSPFWLSGAWAPVKAVLPESVTADIVSESNTPSALRAYIDDDQIPPEFGGSSPFGLGSHPHEERLQELVEKVAFGGEPAGEQTDLSSRRSDRSTSQHLLKNFEGSTSSSIHMSSVHSKLPEKPLRRRIGSIDRSGRYRSRSGGSVDFKGRTVRIGGEYDIFSVISMMHFMVSMIQGMLESGLPLWLLSPINVGGLGYSPSRSGVTMFLACLLLLWVLRTNFSRPFFNLPSKAPMRGLRMGVGTQVVVLTLTVLLPVRSSANENSPSLTVTTLTVIAFCCLTLAGILSFSSSIVLHRTAAEAFTVINTRRRKSWLAWIFGEERFHGMCTSGTFSHQLSLVGQLSGIFFLAPLWSLTIPADKSVPFDATIALCFSSLVGVVLYISSFSLHVNVNGEFSPHPSDTRRGARRVFPFLLEVITVTAGDIASLFEETRWSQPHQLGGPTRSRALSDMSTGFDLMERGQEERQSNRCRKAT